MGRLRERSVLFWIFFTRLMSNTQASGRKLNLRDLLHFAIKTSTDVFVFPMKYKCLCSRNVFFGGGGVLPEMHFYVISLLNPSVPQHWLKPGCVDTRTQNIHSSVQVLFLSFLHHTASGTLSQEQLLYSWTMFLYTFILTRFLVKQGCSDILTQQPLRHSHCFSFSFFF